MSRRKGTAGWGLLPGAFRPFWNGNKLWRAVPVARNSIEEWNTSINTAFVSKTNDEWPPGPTASGDRRKFRPYPENLRQPKTVWWAREDSNLQPSGYEPLALTIELRARAGHTRRGGTWRR
jgi:hypothetical protein